MISIKSSTTYSRYLLASHLKPEMQLNVTSTQEKQILEPNTRGPTTRLADVRSTMFSPGQCTDCIPIVRQEDQRELQADVQVPPLSGFKAFKAWNVETSRSWQQRLRSSYVIGYTILRIDFSNSHSRKYASTL